MNISLSSRGAVQKLRLFFDEHICFGSPGLLTTMGSKNTVHLVNTY